MYTVILLNIANILYMVCYGVRDVLWLRILAVAAMLIIMPYYLFHHRSPDTGPIAWNCVFIAINVFWITLLMRERRPPKLTEEQRRLYSLVFSKTCSERKMLRLLSAGSWQTAADGGVLVPKNVILDELILVYSGAAAVLIDGKRIAKLMPGDFAGEMSFLTKGATVAEVVAEGPVRFVRWQRDDLMRLFHKHSELKIAMYEVIGNDLVEKLTSSAHKIPTLTISLSSQAVLEMQDDSTTEDHR